ncbi:MAG: hypothetical protein GWN00_22860, partial [Aliifodinibius sp.]|nr:hypothetical protein [Fodinibius sp.]NIW46610.1 hypothetical protein [Gammaproteobacteria bacterium]NIY27541.1 hypothetical protein [Fodinibius sp.]
SPRVWQQITGETIPIAAAYMIDKSGTVSLDISGYSPEYALSANLFTMTSGFTDVDIAYDVVTDENFHVYVMG